MGSRRKARIIAVQSLYAWEMASTPVDELLRFQWLDDERRESLDEATLTFSRLLVAGTIENVDGVDQAIERQLEHWDIDRLRRVDLAVLRMSVYSLFYQNDIPPNVVIDEAIDIARLYSIDDSYRFVNGVLDGIRKSQLRHGAQIS